MNRIVVRWSWFDLWIGAYWDQKERALYICPLPTICVRISFAKPKLKASSPPQIEEGTCDFCGTVGPLIQTHHAGRLCVKGCHWKTVSNI